MGDVDGDPRIRQMARRLGDRAALAYALEAMTRIAEELRQPAQLWFAGLNRAKLALSKGGSTMRTP